jgi:hypothetical protein
MTSRKYGRTIVTIFRPPLPPEDAEPEDAEPEDAAAQTGDAETAAEQDDLVADVLGRTLSSNDSPEAEASEEGAGADGEARKSE